MNGKRGQYLVVDLGHTLERIRDHGAKGFYEGKTADDIVAEMKRGNGLISYEDLINYNVVLASTVDSRLQRIQDHFDASAV
jgi:gamma-glutamyltranspeptidase/glutathione hydrolase